VTNRWQGVVHSQSGCQETARITVRHSVAR